MYTFEQLKDDVRKEDEALRVHATKEERERLDINEFNPTNNNQCIYGLVAQGRYSPRAAELIDKCAIRHFDGLPDDMDEAINLLSEKPMNFVYERVNERSGSTFSAIEAYIC